MDNFLPRRPNQDEHIMPSRGAAQHTEQNFRPPTNEESGIVMGSHLHGPKRKKNFKEWLKSLTKKQWIIIGVIAAVILIGAGAGLYVLLKDNKQPAAQQEQTPQEAEIAEPTTVPSNLTGLQVEKAVNDRPTTAIMIENSQAARPQSGLLHAGVVFEAIAEGGITRFMAIYQDSAPDYIGPVRSVRPYYLQWALGFDAAVAHAGGSAEALNYIKVWNVKDLNHNSSYFWRVNNRTSPHNLYTSLPKLWEYEAQKGFGKANFTPLQRKPETPSATPNARTISFNISSVNFNTSYTYDPSTNSYKRFIAGQPSTDEKTGTQLAPKSLVALVMSQGKNDIYTTYGTIGSGQALIFQDGTVTEGTWRKNSNSENFTFTDATGQPIKLIPGQTWFTALGGRDRINYTP